MTRTLILTVGCMLWACASFAQNAILAPGGMLAPEEVCSGDISGRGQVALPLSATARLAWCQDSSNVNIGYHLIVAALGGDRIARELYNQPIAATECQAAPPMWSCSAPFPSIALNVANSQPAGTIVTIRVDNPINPPPDIDNPEELLRSTSMVRALTVTGCQYTPPATGIVETRPVNSSIGGVMTGLLSDVAGRIGQLRRDGWRVEWQLDSTYTAGPRAAVLMWCVGVAQ